MKRNVISILLLFFLLIYLDSEAGVYIHGGSKSLTKKDAGFIAEFLRNNFILTTFNVLFLIPFSFWAKKQKLDDELLLYQVRGRYTKYNISLWLEKVENEFGVRLTKHRNKLDVYVKAAKRSKRSLSVFRSKIDAIIFDAAFGPERRKEAFLRMHKYTKLIIYGQFLQILITVGYSIAYWWYVVKNPMGAFFLGICTAFFIGVVYWLLSNVLMGAIIKIIVKTITSVKGQAGYWHIVSAQLRGFYGAFWPFVPMPQKALLAISEIEMEGSSSFVDFDGGGSEGNF